MLNQNHCSRIRVVEREGEEGKAISRSVFGLALVRYQFRGINKRNKTRPGCFTR